MAFALFIRAISKIRGLISKGVLVIESRIKRIWRVDFAFFWGHPKQNSRLIAGRLLSWVCLVSKVNAVYFVSKALPSFERYFLMSFIAMLKLTGPTA